MSVPTAVKLGDPEAIAAYKSRRKETTARYREKNRKRIREDGRQYYWETIERQRDRAKLKYARNREKSLAKSRAWNKAHPERMRAATCRWLEKNRDVANQRHRERHAANPQKYRLKVKAYFSKHPEVKRAIDIRRRARKIAAAGDCTAADIAAIYKLQRGKCALCRISIKRGYHIDHILPVALGGSGSRRNLQLLCQPCNNRKHAKHPLNYARQIGLLL